MSGTIFGVAGSTCTQRIFVVANELGVALKLHPIDFAKGEHKQQPHLSRQPFGKVPAYESADGKVKLFESRAIARYIDAKSGAKLTHVNNAEEAAIIDTWSSVEQAYFDKPASTITFEQVFKQYRGLTTDPEVVKKEKATLSEVLDVYDQQLATRPFLAGDRLSVADLFHLPYGAHLFRLHPDLLTSHPHVNKWWTTISNLESWKKTLAASQH